MADLRAGLGIRTVLSIGYDAATMKQYWAKHQGRIRWGVRTAIETSDALYKSEGGLFFVWADRVELRDGSLVFLNEDGAIQGALASTPMTRAAPNNDGSTRWRGTLPFLKE